MATVPVPVKQSALAPADTPDVWSSLRSEMDRLFDTFTGRFGVTPFLSTRFGTLSGVLSPAVDITEEEGAFKVSAEVPGMAEKEIQVSLSGDTLTIKGEKRQEREEKGKTATCRNAATESSSAPSRYPRMWIVRRSRQHSPMAFYRDAAEDYKSGPKEDRSQSRGVKV